MNLQDAPPCPNLQAQILSNGDKNKWKSVVNKLKKQWNYLLYPRMGMLSEQVRLLQRILGISRIMTFATWDCHRVGRLQAVNKSETLNTQESNRARRMSWHNIEPQALPLVVPQSQPFPKLSQIIFPAYRPLPSVRRYELNQMWFNKNTDYHAGNCQIPYTLPIWGIIAYFLAQNLTSKIKTVATSAHEIFCEGVCGEFHLLQF